MSFSAYPEYKDSGVPWLGTVPSHWKVSPVKAVATFNDDVLTEATDPELEIDYIEISDVEEAVGVKAATPMTFGDAPSRARRIVREGDILVSTVRTYLRAIAPVPKEFDGSIASTGFCVIRGSLADSGFLGYALRSEAFVAEVISRSVGVSYPAINASDLVSIKVPLPPLVEQTAIAAFLDRETAKIDALVAEQERLIALLREKRQAVVSRTVTKGLDPHASTKASGIAWLGEIPAHWDVMPFWWLFKFVKRQEGRPGEILSVYREFGVIPKSSRTDNNNKTPEDISSYQEVNIGDLVINKMKSWQGSLGISQFSGITSPDYAVFEPCRDSDPGFINQLLRSQNLPAVFRSISNGIRSNQWRLEPQKLKSLRIPVPPLDEQLAISAALEKISNRFIELAREAQTAITLLQQRRAALISAAVTGKIDLRAATSPDNVISIRTARTIAAQPSLRALVGGMSIRALGSKGRMAVMKGGYLAESYAGVSELGGTYRRNAAGPYCSAVIDGMERDAAQAFGIEVIEPSKDGGRVTYHVPGNVVLPASDLRALFGDDRAKRVTSLFDLLKDLSRDGVEAVATLFAVWNDLLASGQTANKDAIICGVLDDWHPEKALKFNRDTLAHWLAWMRRNHIVPDGTAPRTDHQGSLFQ